MIKVVFIDIDNTLLDFNKSSAQAIEKSFIEHNLPYSDHVFNTFIKTNVGLWQRIERGEFTREQLHQERWNMILKQLQLKYDGVKIEQSFLGYLYECAIPVPNALDLVKYLAKKYYLCTASNAPHDQQINRLTVSGIKPYVKQIFTSESLGADKPSKTFFDRCFERLDGAEPKECLIIGDSLTADIAGGKNYGLQTIWYNHNLEPLPQDKIYDYTVNSLMEITKIL